MKKFIKNFKINRIKKKILSHEISADSYERWAEDYEKPTQCCECNNMVIGNGISQRDNASYHRHIIIFLKKKLKELEK